MCEYENEQGSRQALELQQTTGVRHKTSCSATCYRCSPGRRELWGTCIVVGTCREQVPALGNLFLRTLRFSQSTCGKGSSDREGWRSCAGYPKHSNLGHILELRRIPTTAACMYSDPDLTSRFPEHSCWTCAIPDSLLGQLDKSVLLQISVPHWHNGG